MVSYRSRRLESILGRTVATLEASHIDALVKAGAREDFDLDFKAELYGRSDSSRRDLAGDVAALANTAGGIIIIGVAEDDQARAVAAPGVEISDAERVRMLQVIASTVAPMPIVDVLTLPLSHEAELGEAADGIKEPSEDGAPARGFYVLAVPASPSAPHAVQINDGFRYPRRNGASIRYLSEGEVSAAYRGRFVTEQAQLARIVSVESEAVVRLVRDKRPWMLVSLVPDSPGSTELNQAAYRRFRAATVGRAAYEVLGGWFGVSFQRASVGRRRFLVDGTWDDGVLADRVSAEFHSDGSGAYALALPDLREGARQERPDANVSQLADDEALALAILTGLRRLALHARDWAATGGAALLRARILPSPSVPEGVHIGHTRGFGLPAPRSRWAVTNDESFSETVADLDELADVGPDLVSVSARLLDEVGHAFGIPEMGQFTNEGQVRIRYWSRECQQAVQTWAIASAIPVTDETLEE